MKPKVFATSIVSLSVAATAAGFAFGLHENPFGEGEQIFNVTERIELEAWPKASAPLVLKNHFESSQIINAGNRGELGVEFEPVILDIYKLSRPDASQPFIELSGTLVADQIMAKSNWKGIALCTGEGIRKCDYYLLWPESLEGSANVTFVSVHLGEGKWGAVEKNLLAELTPTVGAQ